MHHLYRMFFFKKKKSEKCVIVQGNHVITKKVGAMGKRERTSEKGWPKIVVYTDLNRELWITATGVLANINVASIALPTYLVEDRLFGKSFFKLSWARWVTFYRLLLLLSNVFSCHTLCCLLGLSEKQDIPPFLFTKTSKYKREYDLEQVLGTGTKRKNWASQNKTIT